MALQAPSSSSSSRKIDLNYFMTQLCAIAQVPINEQEDITCQRFGESLLDYLRKRLERWSNAKRLIQDVLIDVAAPQPFKCEAGEVQNSATQPPPPTAAGQSHGHNTSSELSQIAPNENNELLVNGPILRSPSPEVVILQYIPPRISQFGNGKNDDNATTSPPLSPTLPEEDEQSYNHTLEELGHPQSTIATEVGGTPFGLEDSLINDSSPGPLPSSSSRQLRQRNQKAGQYEDNRDWENTFSGTTKKNKTKKRRTQQVLKRMHHEPRNDVGDRFFQCICGSYKFSTKQARDHHIKLYTAEWKFKCTECPETFYTLPLLKAHLKKQHGMVNPLKDYVVGDPQTGKMFKTRTEFCEYKRGEKTKWVAAIRTNQHLARSLVNKSSRLLGMPPLSPAVTPRGFMFSPRRPAMSPRPKQTRMASTQTGLTIKYSLRMPSQMLKINSPHQTNDDEEQSHGESLQHSRQQAHDSRSHEQMDEEEQHQGAMTTENVDTVKGLSDNANCKMSGKLYGCVVCDKVFPDLIMLRAHLSEQHNSDSRKVKCVKCKIIFGSCKIFHHHWNVAKH